MKQEESITLQSLQSHVIKTFVGSFAAAIISAVVVGFSFYYKTSTSLEYLLKENEKNREIINKHTEQLTLNQQTNYVSDYQIKNLEQRIKSIEIQQQEIMRILIEINTNQKTLIKNSK
jgi:acyl-CoA synthetase (AMP-forming)/AMP-acid ligase II